MLQAHIGGPAPEARHADGPLAGHAITIGQTEQPALAPHGNEYKGGKAPGCRNLCL